MRHSQLIHPSIQKLTAALSLLASSLYLQAQVAEPPTLTHDHADIGIAFAEGSWDLHVHDGASDTEYEPSAVWLEVGPHALIPVPDSPAFAFLGEPGTPSWILPETDNHDLLFLGLGTEEIEPGTFQDDSVTLTLLNLTGPGYFALYQTDPFGNPVVRMNSTDGITEEDHIQLATGGHAHANWAFSAPGQYRITLQASATLAADGQPTTSDAAEYLFTVSDQPVLTITPKDNATFSVSWMSLPGHNYQLQTLLNLGDNSWINLAENPITGTGRLLSFDVSRSPATRFLRLEVQEAGNESPAP